LSYRAALAVGCEGAVTCRTRVRASVESTRYAFADRVHGIRIGIVGGCCGRCSWSLELAFMTRLTVCYADS